MPKNGYDFYLDKCLLPIAPEKLTIKINNANKTFTIINDGEINILKKAELSDIEFECRIPQTSYPFAQYKNGFLDASYFLNYFETLKVNKSPFQFIVSRAKPNGDSLFSTNMTVSMEDYKITEQASNGFDLIVKIKLKQYRAYSTKTVTIKNGTGKSTATVDKKRPSTNNTKAAKRYTVVKGDCLWNIAKKFYGNGAKWPVIYNANKSVVGGNPNLIYAGQLLTFPAI